MRLTPSPLVTPANCNETVNIGIARDCLQGSRCTVQLQETRRAQDEFIFGYRHVAVRTIISTIATS